jgi:hypothetical protein
MSTSFQVQALLSQLSEPEKLADLLNMSNQQDKDLISQSSPEVMALALEYAKLAVLPQRSIEEDDRFGQILEVATHNDILSFWIVEADHFLGHHLGLLDEDARESYRDQQVLLMEYLGEKGFLTPIHKQIKTYQCTTKGDLYHPDDDPIRC